MRIACKPSEYDYYDCIQHAGQDQSLVYIRTRKRINFEDYKNPWPFPYLHGMDHSRIVQHVVGFCGKIYPIIKILPKDKGEDIFCVTEEQLKKELSRDPEFTMENSWIRSSWNRRWIGEGFFNECKTESPRYKSMFEEHKCPIFVGTRLGRWGRDSYMEINGNLKAVGFMKIFDPYQAFQEIMMYLSNMAMPNKPIPHIDDVTMAEAKGFDEFSFRKPKSSKKRRA
jgi:hypothetical protein